MDGLNQFTITKEDGTKELCMLAFTYDSPEFKKSILLILMVNLIKRVN